VQKSPNGSRSNTAPKQHKAPGKPFTKNDPRINRNGRPKSFDQCRTLAQQIAHEVVVRSRDGLEITTAEAILRQWANSPEPMLQNKFMEIAFGKVPDKLETIIDDKRTLTLYYDHERPEVINDRN